MSAKALNVKRIIQLQTQLLKIIEDSSAGKITEEEAKIKSDALNRQLDRRHYTK